MRTTVAHKVCESAGYCLRDNITPPTSRPRPARKPSATRSSGGTRLLSNEYLTKRATPRNNASPPAQANSFTPMNCSQPIVGMIALGACFAGSSAAPIGGGPKAGADSGLGGGDAPRRGGGGVGEFPPVAARQKPP